MGFNILYQLIKELKEKNAERKKRELKARILRYFEQGQENVNGCFYQTVNSLKDANLFKAEDFDKATEALTELVREGFVEYLGGSYYLKGHAPKY